METAQERTIAAFKTAGFELPSFTPTGAVIRFQDGADDKKEAGWYVCFENHTNKGEVFYAGKIGSWKRDEQPISFCSLGAIPKTEKLKIDKNWKEAQVAFEKQSARIHEETALQCSKKWDAYAGSEQMTAYLESKGLEKTYGTRTVLTENGRSLVLPARDLNEKLWTLQLIYPDGTKRFSPGGKKKGNFFWIAGSSDEIYLCEGFATGATIYEALRKNVAVAFDAGNLMPVAKALKEKYPKHKIFVCGDDDVFSEKGNKGRSEAEKVAQFLGTPALFPQFQDLEKSPSDFNDLYVSEGIEVVREQLEATTKKAPSIFIDCLGFTKGSYFYRSSSNLEITRVSQHSEEALLNLMPRSYWDSRYRSEQSGTLNWGQAKSDLMESCRLKGQYDKELIRGLGIWNDGDKVVTHLGDRLYYDGSENHLNSLKSEYHYELSKRIPSVHPNPLTVEELSPLMKAFNILNFKNNQQKYFLGGWLATAPLCGLLKWRPHLWLTGQPGSGKSEVRNSLVLPLIKQGFHALSFIGDSTEAGIRRTVLSHALPIVFDEIETDDHYSMEAVQKTLRYIRQASTEQDGQIVKAGAGMLTETYSARFVAFLSSIEASLKHQADKDRFTIIEVTKEGQSPEQYKNFLDRMRWFTPENAQRFVSRCIQMAPILLQNHEVLQATSIGSQRFGAQHGTLLAGWSILTGDHVLTKSEAEDLWATIDWSEKEEERPEGQECLDFLLNKIVHFSGESCSIRRLVKSNEPHHRKQLLNYRMKIMDNGHLFIDRNSTEVRKWFHERGSKWMGEHRWCNTILRIPGVESKIARLKKDVDRGLMVPISIIHD